MTVRWQLLLPAEVGHTDDGDRRNRGVKEFCSGVKEFCSGVKETGGVE